MVASVNGYEISDQALARIAGLTKLQRLGLINTPITDRGIEYLSGMVELEGLWLIGTQVGDASLATIKNVARLRDLNLGVTKTTDEGLKEIQSLPRLEKLDLNAIKVTDHGLRYLEPLTNLERLDLGPGVTEAGLQYLASVKRAKPLRVCWDRITPKGRETIERTFPASPQLPTAEREESNSPPNVTPPSKDG
jgi:Leucine-rich repeat (LRR) protein